MQHADPKSFFPEIKREISLDNWAPKFNSESEKRFRLDISIPLTGHPLVGMPSFIGDAFEALAQDDSAVDTMTLSPEVEGITFDFFATPTTPRTMLITAATLRGLELVAKGEEDSRTVTLRFNTTVPANHGLLVWLYENHGATMWAKFEESQATLAGAESAQMKLSEQPSEDDEDTSEEETKAAARRPRGFSKPTNASAVR